MNHLQVDNPQEKKKRKTKTKNPSPPPSPPPLFSLLPNEIVENCVARISRSYYTKLSIVSKSLHSLISSTELYETRTDIGTTEECLYVCLSDPNYRFTQWFTLWINPNQTLPNGMVKKKKKKNQRLLVPIPSPDFPSVSNSIVSVGFEIFVIGGPVWNHILYQILYQSVRAPSSAVRVLDCRTHTWRNAPSMNVARKNAFSCVFDDKIYVIGGCHESEAPFAEVFDTKTQTWEHLPERGDAIRKCRILKIGAVEGRIWSWCGNINFAYDTNQGTWESIIWPEDFIVSRHMLECIVDNVSYCFGRSGYSRYGCWWYDINDNNWKEVKGLDSLGDKYKRNGGISGHKAKMFSYCGKLLVVWLGYKRRLNHKMKVWCAEISLENRRDNGEIWGNVEWVDVVHTVPSSCKLLESLVVSV